MDEKKLREQEVINNQKEEKKENRRSKKRLFLLLLLLIVTGVMLSTSTYAWFTSNRTVTVEDINVNVAASGGIQVSVDGTSWKSIITNDDLKNANVTYSAATNQIPSVLKPVSTAAKSLNDDGYLSMWLGTVETSNTITNRGQYILTSKDVSVVKDNSAADAGADAGSNGHFVMFDLFIRLDDNGQDKKPLYLTKTSNVTFKSGGTDLGTQNAARVAFINEGETATGSDVATIQALKTTDISKIYLWEPNYDAHTNTGISNALSFYNSTNSGDAYNKANRKESVPYFGTIAEVTTENDVLLSKANATDNATQFAAVTPNITTKSTWGTEAANYEKLFDLSPNKIAKVRIYFWVEGQDIDCENNASGGDITLKLQFSLNNKDGVAA